MMRLVGIGLLVVAPLVCGGSIAAAQAPQGPKDQAEKSGSIPDQNGKQEPTVKFTPDSHPSPNVFVNGALAVPGASAQTQTTPAKFSAENDPRDRIPIMARGPQLDDAQKELILAAIRDAHRPVAGVETGPAMELPTDIAMHERPLTLVDRVPAMKDTKYVQLSGKVLIVRPANRIVIGEIAD